MGWLIDRMTGARCSALRSQSGAADRRMRSVIELRHARCLLVWALVCRSAGNAWEPLAHCDVIPKRQRNTAISIYVSGAAIGQILIFISVAGC